MLDFFRRKLNLPTNRYDDIEKGMHDRAFVVAGAMKADLLDDLRRAVGQSISTGTGLDEFRSQFSNIVQRHGWTGWTGEGTAKGEAWRPKVVFETNLRTSYAAGRYAQLTEPGLLKRRPFWQYVHSGNEHARLEHKAWSDSLLTLRADDPFWKTHYPPNGFGCGCYVHAVAAPADGSKTEPPNGWNIPTLKTGTPPGIDPGWDYAPGAARTTPLADLVEQKLINLSAPIGAKMWEAMAPVIEMERALKWTETVDAWQADPVPRGRTAIIGALSNGIISALRDKSLPIPASAEIAIIDRLIVGAKQRRHTLSGNALSVSEWRALPRLVTQSKADGRIYLDTHSGKIIFVADGETDATKIVVEFNPKKTGAPPLNHVDTAFRVSATDIDASIKGKIWKPL